MSLHDAISAAIGPMRRLAESLMTDTCTIVRPGRPVTDPDTGVTTTPTTTVYEGRCKVRSYRPHEQTPEVGNSSPSILRYDLHVPYGAGPFEPGDVVTVAGAKYAAPFRITTPHDVTWQTAQRIQVDIIETSSGGA